MTIYFSPYLFNTIWISRKNSVERIKDIDHVSIVQRALVEMQKVLLINGGS